MIRLLIWGVVLLLLLGCLPGVALAKQGGSKPATTTAAGQEGDTQGIEPRNPAPAYVLSILALGFVLTIICMPSRKG